MSKHKTAELIIDIGLSQYHELCETIWKLKNHQGDSCHFTINSHYHINHYEKLNNENNELVVKGYYNKNKDLTYQFEISHDLVDGFQIIEYLVNHKKAINIRSLFE